MQPPRIDGEAARRWFRAALTGMADAREEIDALNVFPVPDGDTGTNLYLTLEAAVAAADAVPGDDPGSVLRAAARGALLGARGNAGVILSQMLLGTAEVVAACAGREVGPADVADALERAAELAYASVGTPVEGTMLSVARAVAQAARADVQAGVPHLGALVRTVVRASHTALAMTPQQLEVLARAGVVDAGGRGLTVMYEALESVVTGHRVSSVARGAATRMIPVPERGTDFQPGGPAYEVMFLLEAAEVHIPSLRERLAALGDSLVVVGGGGLWNVHVHVDDVGAAVEAGIETGRPYRIRVTHFADQVSAQRRARDLSGGRTVVAVAAGDGLAQLFADAGAVVVRTAPMRRPSTAEVIEAIVRAGTREVVVLPNDPNVVPVANAAATEAGALGIAVSVIPTKAQVQGIAALAVHEPGRAFNADVVAMTNAAAHTRSGAVTVAAKEAMTSAGRCRPGDILGAVEGDFVVLGDDILAVANDVIARMLSPGGELLTLVTGADADDALARAVQAHATARNPTLDVLVYAGGQPRYPLLVGVE